MFMQRYRSSYTKIHMRWPVAWITFEMHAAHARLLVVPFPMLISPASASYVAIDSQMHLIRKAASELISSQQPYQYAY